MAKKYQVLLLLSILSVITFLDRNAISIAGIVITPELGMNEVQFGWVLAAFTISYGIFEIPTGLWGDRNGEKKTLMRIVIWWSVFTALTGLVSGFYSLLTVRFLFGIGEAGAYPNTAIAIRRWFPVEERARAQSLIWMASRLGGALTPLLVIPMQSHFGWRITFYILGAIGLVWAISWLLLYREPSKKDQSAIEKKQINWSEIVRNKSFWALLGMYYCYAGGVFFFISWLPKYLYQGRGISKEELTYSASMPFLLAAFGCLAGGILSDALVRKVGLNWGRKIVPLAGLSLSGIAMILVSFSTHLTVVVGLLSLGLALMDVTAPVAWALATGMGKENSGAVTGAMNTAGLLGGTIASIGIGYLINQTGSYEVPVIAIGIQLLVGAALSLSIKGES